MKSAAPMGLRSGMTMMPRLIQGSRQLTVRDNATASRRGGQGRASCVVGMTEATRSSTSENGAIAFLTARLGSARNMMNAKSRVLMMVRARPGGHALTMQLRTPPSLELPSGPALFVLCFREAADTDVERAILDALQDMSITLFLPDATPGESARERRLSQWDLTAMEHSTLIGMWLDVKSSGDDAFLELGLWAPSGKLIVGCPSTTPSRDLIEMICTRHAVPLVDEVMAFVSVLRERLTAATD